ncbi:cytochrome c oxidase subunit II [Natronomonas sp. EA1]|uniref:cytochrome c oxidase subunit II n=1 Tax=Natronomonas sp. EA1 TaxID=3421655 RepID=UPI003EB8BCEF
MTQVPVVPLPLHNGGSGGFIPRGARTAVFEQIYWVFLILGTVVGVVVIGYMCWNAYTYRDTGRSTGGGDGGDRPSLGELPRGSGGGKKLFVSFGLSTIVVVSLVAWSYGTLLYVEQPTHPQVEGPAEDAEVLEIRVEGYRFGWEFVYPNGHRTSELRLPVDREVRFLVTSRDVFHNFGIPDLRVKADAIPGQTTETWAIPTEPGTYRANCYELCGAGHSAMHAPVIVLTQAEYDAWYANTTAS